MMSLGIFSPKNDLMILQDVIFFIAAPFVKRHKTKLTNLFVSLCIVFLQGFWNALVRPYFATYCDFVFQ